MACRIFKYWTCRRRVASRVYDAVLYWKLPMMWPSMAVASTSAKSNWAKRSPSPMDSKRKDPNDISDPSWPMKKDGKQD